MGTAHIKMENKDIVCCGVMCCELVVTVICVSLVVVNMFCWYMCMNGPYPYRCDGTSCISSCISSYWSGH